MELEKSAEQVLPERRRGRRWGQEQEREMTQIIYAHVNK
jgi:hypothetical protein